MTVTAAALATERLALVQRLRDLPDDQWATPSLCAGWTVHHVLAHLTTPFLVSRPVMGLQFVRSRGISAAMDDVTHRLARRPPAELLDVLQAHAASTFRPPGLPLSAPMTDAVVHGADIRWGLGDAHADWGDPARLEPVLGFLTGRRAALGFVPPGRLTGLRLVADDLDWSSGRGDEVRGPALPLAMGVLGRTAALAHLAGDGVAVLRSRVG